jgi:hypothetical protein
VVNSGRITLHHQSRLHHIGLGATHNGTAVMRRAASMNIQV